MHVGTTTDPFSLHDVPDLEYPPCLYEGDAVNGLEIYFELKKTRSLSENRHRSEGSPF
ncbi:MAG: hypothetical protein ABW185_18840 [Sedimenticola sp.]